MNLAHELLLPGAEDDDRAVDGTYLSQINATCIRLKTNQSFGRCTISPYYPNQAISPLDTGDTGCEDQHLPISDFQNGGVTRGVIIAFDHFYLRGVVAFAMHHILGCCIQPLRHQQPLISTSSNLKKGNTAYLSARLFACSSAYLSIHLSAYMSAYLSAYLSTYLFAYLAVYLAVCLCLYNMQCD